VKPDRKQLSDPAAGQHLGTVRLCREGPIADAYNAVTDVAEAADQVSAAIEQGATSRILALLMACPRLSTRTFIGPAAAGVLALLHGQLDEARRLFDAAAQSATDTQRRALATRLVKLAGTYPGLETAIGKEVSRLRE
jgi:hypothetical protein